MKTSAKRKIKYYWPEITKEWKWEFYFDRKFKKNDIVSLDGLWWSVISSRKVKDKDGFVYKTYCICMNICDD